MAALKPGARKEMVVEIQATEKEKEGRREGANYTGHSSCSGLHSTHYLRAAYKTKGVMFLAVLRGSLWLLCKGHSGGKKG